MYKEARPAPPAAKADLGAPGFPTSEEIMPPQVSKLSLAQDTPTFASPLPALSDSQGPQSQHSYAWTTAAFAYAKRIASASTEARLNAYREEKAAFEEALSIKWLPRDAQQLKDTLEATRFIDWPHMAAALLEVFRSRGRLSVLEHKLQYLYNATGSANDPQFQNMQGVNQFLKNTREPAGLKRLCAVHRLAMKGQVDGIRKSELGRVRDYSVIGCEETGLNALHIQRINRNPYLSYDPKAPTTLNLRSQALIPGSINYPDPIVIKAEALDRIKESAPDIYHSVVELKSKTDAERTSLREHPTAEFAQLTREFVTALVQERYQAFHEQVLELGSLDSPQKVLKYIKCVALHYRDLISIHPLGDGNGRTLRYESLYAPLDAVGISRPRLMDVDADLLYSPSAWGTEVERGILSTDQVYQDITKRIELGLRVESCPELVFPNIIRQVGIELRSRGKKQTLKNVKLHAIDGGQFGAFVDTTMMLEPSLKSTFQRDPVTTLTALRDDYKAFAKKNIILAHVPKKGTEEFGLYLVDFDQRATFGVPLAANKTQWQYKRERWYLNEYIWRGMCREDKELSTKEMLDIFRSLSWISLSNNSSSLVGKSAQKVLKAVQSDFDEYNRELVTGDLYKMVQDHVGEGERYDCSYGLSTSRKWCIAAGFAWGLGAFGYDAKEVKDAQPLIKSRVLIGALQGIKDVDVRRFKMIDPRFSYKFGRQQEIMAVGGLDPDMIMTVQLLDSKRKIEKSFVRNPDLPSEIWEVAGGVDLKSVKLTELPAGVVVRKHRLF